MSAKCYYILEYCRYRVRGNSRHHSLLRAANVAIELHEYGEALPVSITDRNGKVIWAHKGLGTESINALFELRDSQLSKL